MYNLQKEYYTKSLKFINEKIGNTNFLFFSNDIVWCKENFGDEFEYIDERYGFQDYHEFELMKLCHHNIIANSTFSWWAAYLNDNVNKIVIAPEQWYANKSAQRRHEKNDFIPENWIKL